MNQAHLDLAEEMGVEPKNLFTVTPQMREDWHKAGRCPVHGCILEEKFEICGDNGKEYFDWCEAGQHQYNPALEGLHND